MDELTFEYKNKTYKIAKVKNADGVDLWVLSGTEQALFGTAAQLSIPSFYPIDEGMARDIIDYGEMRERLALQEARCVPCR